MEDKVNYGLVGAFVLVLGAALIVAVLWLAAGLSGKKQYEPYQTIVRESVAGLDIDAPVKYLGVDVGKVSRISLDPRNPRQVQLRFQIERGTPIRSDTEAVLKTQGLTGISYIELTGGGVDAPPLTRGENDAIPTIRSKPSLGARLEDVLTNVATNLDRTSASLNELLDSGNRAALKSTLADAASIARMLSQQQDALDTGIAAAVKTANNSAAASAQLTALLTRLTPTLDKVAGLLDRVGPALDRVGPVIDRIGAGADAFGNAARVAGRSLSSLEHTADATARGVQQLNIETLPGIDRLLNELNELAPSLRRVAEQLDRQPNSVLLGGAARRAGPGEAGAQ